MNDRPISAPAFKFNYQSALPWCDRTELSFEQVTETLVVRRNQKLSALPRSTKKVDQTEKIEIIQALKRIIKYRCL
jgi:hypothetical protein